MGIGNIECGAPVRLTGSGAIAGNGTALSGAQSESAGTASECAILGFYVASTSSGTIKITNISGGAAGSTTYVNTITPSVGWNYLPIAVKDGLWATIGATIDVTFVVCQS